MISRVDTPPGAAGVAAPGEAASSPPSMLRSSLGMTTGRAASMALGFLFWLLAARLFPPTAVGLTAGIVSSMMLCTQLALLGVGSAFIARFPRHQHAPAVLLDTAISIIVASAATAAAFFLLLSFVVLRELRVVAVSPRYAVLFVVMCVLGTLNILFDQVSMALGRGGQLLTRNVLFGVVAAGLLIPLHGVAPGVSSAGLFSLWVIAGACACGLAGLQLWRSLGRYRYRPGVERAVAGKLIRVGLPNHALTLTERAPGLVLPVIVTELLSPAQNAVWYPVWMMAWVVYIVPISMGIALFAQVSHRPEALAGALRSGVRSSLLFGAAAASGVVLLGDLALGLLGEQYAARGSSPLRLLVVAVVPLTAVQAYFAVCRARGRLLEAIVTGTASGMAAVGAGAAAAMDHGLNGMASAWVATQMITGAWALLRLRKLRRENPDTPGG